MATRIFLPEPSAASFRLGALVKALATRFTRVSVVTTTFGEDARAGRAAPSSAIPVWVSRWPVLRDGSGYVRGYVPYMSFDAPLALRLLFARRPDAVVVEPPPTTGAVVRVICWLRRIPYVYYAADIWSDATASTGAPPAVVSVVRWLEKFTLAGASATLSVNDGVTRRVRELGASDVVTVGNGVDIEVFNRGGSSPGAGQGAGQVADSAAGGSEDAAGGSTLGSAGGSRRGGADSGAGIPTGKFLLYAGTASEWQGAEIFAAAMEQVRQEVPDAKIVFLGQGSSWPALREWAEKLPAGSIELHDPVDAATSAIWQRAAHAGLVSLKPGIGYDFAMPTKMFAALACGTPVVFSGVRGARELIAKNKLGWGCDYDVDQVAGAMIAALAAEPGSDNAGGVDAGGVAGPARLARWVEENRSLQAAAARGAEAVARVAGIGEDSGPMRAAELSETDKNASRS